MNTNYIDELNESQCAAVTYNDGPSLVIAGAGSGKTRVLTYKIAYLLENGYVTGRPYMGITYLAVTDAQTAAQLGVSAYGIYVVDVVSGGPADQAGLKAGDRIISIDNTEVAQKTDLGTLMQEHSAGDTLSITIARDGQMQTVSLTLGEKNASNSGSASTNGAARQETPSESAPQQDPQG